VRWVRDETQFRTGTLVNDSSKPASLSAIAVVHFARLDRLVQLSVLSSEI